MKKTFPLHWKQVLLALVVAYGLVIAWPMRHFLAPRFLFGRTLIIFTNEAEARPCGGFVSAYGIARMLPPVLRMHNVYDLEGSDFGKADFPIDRVSSRKKFWDLGVSSELSQCASAFKAAYEDITDENISGMILADFATLEKAVEIFGPIQVHGQTLDHKNLFSALSRSVADVDRHDEAALAGRKSLLSALAKKLLWKGLMHPHRWAEFAYYLDRKIEKGDFFVAGSSPDIVAHEDDFSVIEWNLGGAKTSRFLQKTLRVRARETSREKWSIGVDVEAENLGGIDEPLSQDWKGVLELRFPSFLGQQAVFQEASLSPGEATSFHFEYAYEGSLKELSFFQARGQKVWIDAAVSLFPQQAFVTEDRGSHENVLSFREKLTAPRTLVSWATASDDWAPFLTLHEIIANNQLAPSLRSGLGLGRGSLVVEVHFNEKIKLTENFSATLEDRDFQVKDVSVSPIFADKKLLEDERTLLLVFDQAQYQKHERYFLTLRGVVDFFGNRIASEKRTVIDRREE